VTPGDVFAVLPAVGLGLVPLVLPRWRLNLNAFLCGHQVALLHDGRLARLGPPEEVVTAESLREIYGVELALPDDRGSRRVCVPRLTRPGGVSSGRSEWS
jgi:ABC-type hemin transport system ATPase subunit